GPVASGGTSTGWNGLNLTVKRSTETWWCPPATADAPAEAAAAGVSAVVTKADVPAAAVAAARIAAARANRGRDAGGREVGWSMTGSWESRGGGNEEGRL